MALPGMNPHSRRAAPWGGRSLRDCLIGVGIALGALAIGAAQPPTRVRKPSMDDTIKVSVYADNSFVLYINGELVAVDRSTSFRTTS